MAEPTGRGYHDKARNIRKPMSDPHTARPPSADMIRFRDALAASYARHPPLDSLSIEAARAVAETVRAPWTEGGPAMRRSRDVTTLVDGLELRLRVHLPAPDPDGMLVYVHGGGWTLFSLDTHDRLMREYAARARLAVVGIDYSLAPEAVFPRAVQEIASLLRFLGGTEAAAVLGLETACLPLAVGGDSAGGNLAMASALALRDAGDALPQAIVVNYGVVDPDESRASYALYGGAEYNLSPDEMRGFWHGYSPDRAARTSPYAALLRGSLHGLPPCFLAIAECDVLRDENLALAEALDRDGVAVSRTVYDGMLHSFLEAVSISATADRALGETASWLRAVFGLPPVEAGKD